MDKRKKVLIVDDSKAIRIFLKEILEKDPNINVVGMSEDPYDAREKIKELNPDVITLDVEMPKMDGITFLKNIMRLHPIPVVMISSLTEAGAEITLEALKLGAIDYIAKEQPKDPDRLAHYISEIQYKVKYASLVDVTKKQIKSPIDGKNEIEVLSKKIIKNKHVNERIKKIITIGASTGGPEAIRKILKSTYLPDCAVIIVQHMPERFIKSFAKSLNHDTKFGVKVLESDEEIIAGNVYIAPGQKIFTVNKTSSNNFQSSVSDQDIELSPKGDITSINAAFNVFAELLGELNVSILLTGMGKDGADGLKNIHALGGATIVQDKETSAVWGMPGSAVKLDAVDAILPIQGIGPALEHLLK